MTDDPILALEEELRRAQLAGVTAALARLLDDELVFTGIDGRHVFAFACTTAAWARRWPSCVFCAMVAARALRSASVSFTRTPMNAKSPSPSATAPIWMARPAPEAAPSRPWVVVVVISSSLAVRSAMAALRSPDPRA